jgi:cob(I)alamin adenosyltransferase
VTVKKAPTEGPARATRKAASVVIVNTGDGKGKSTAAFGTALRAVARGWRVCVIQFIKSGSWKVGERDAATRLGVEWWSIGDGFTWDSRDMKKTEAVAREAWRVSREKIASGDYGLVVLDEITYPMQWGWIATAEVVEAIRSRPARVNVIATGRDAPRQLIAAADTVTEMRKRKHAFDDGVRAIRGIDF